MNPTNSISDANWLFGRRFSDPSVQSNMRHCSMSTLQSQTSKEKSANRLSLGGARESHHFYIKRTQTRRWKDPKLRCLNEKTRIMKGDDYLEYLLLNPNHSLEDDLLLLDPEFIEKSNDNTPWSDNGIRNPNPFDDHAVWHMFKGQTW
ncbi:hypothetical protein ACJRO7_010970 [Eucalyptus globulus]|uniref:Uncharacterized protein n=1 Tax=Eucalyptus globulus TaxID=34317 RepID=A0ABD3LNJ6_EUCGL